MYQVLLVDDEPIILSGIKFLIDWHAIDCHIVATMKNGGEAMEAIESLKPDIVVCDINMPVLNGIEVLKRCSVLPQAPVFIMLTNLEEFSLAQESLRYNAVDYLVKSNLEPKTLENSLLRAIEEREKRGKLERVEMADNYLSENRTHFIKRQVNSILNSSEPMPKRVAALQEQNAADGAFTAHIMLDFSALPSLSEFTVDDKARLFQWEREVCEKLAGNFFKDYFISEVEDYPQSLLLYCWNTTSEEISASISRFFTKLESASANITQTKLGLLATNVYSGSDGLEKIKKELFYLRNCYYLTKSSTLFAWKKPDIKFVQLDMQDICTRFISELRAKNASACISLFDKIYNMLCDVPHTRNDGIKACTELYSVVSMVLSPLLTETVTSTYLAHSSQMLNAIRLFKTRSEALLWLSELKRQSLAVLEGLTFGKNDIVEKAKQFVQQNAEKRIMLNDVADYVSISPSYLSALFKKEFNQNFVDFINETKINLACDFIKEGKYRIYEISYKLSFENPYYFTKVFKRYTGCTPTEYQRKFKKEE